MKIDYISAAFFSDVDVSFLSELRNYADLHYFVFTGKDVRGSAINVDSNLKAGLYRASEFSQLTYLSDLIDLSKTTIVHRSKGTFSFFINLLITFRVCFMLLNRKSDLVHVTFILRHFEWPLYLFAKKMVLSVHDPVEHSSTSSPIKRFYRKVAFGIPKKYVIFNKSQRQDFINKYKIVETQVVNSQLSIYSFLRYLNQNEAIFETIKGKQYILFFGTITRYKGLDVLLESMKEVHKVLPELNVIIAGGGRIYFPVDEYKQLSYVTIINRFIQNDELATLIRNSLFVVCPYRDATQSGVIMSSFSLSKPVIATNVGGLAEMVRDGINGIIIPPNSVNSLTQAIVALYQNHYLLNMMTENICNDYEDGNSSWKTIVKKMWTDLYSKPL